MADDREPGLDDALGRGDETVVRRWAQRGDAVSELAACLSGERRVPVPEDVGGRETADRLTDVVVALARAQPEAFWREFSRVRWSEDGLVLRGIGTIDRPEACALLVAASDRGPAFHRMDAVIGLGGQSHPSAVPALVRALDDPEYLVRYHALQGLARRGDARARGAVEAFRVREGISDYERELAAQVLAGL